MPTAPRNRQASRQDVPGELADIQRSGVPQREAAYVQLEGRMVPVLSPLVHGFTSPRPRSFRCLRPKRGEDGRRARADGAAAPVAPPAPEVVLPCERFAHELSLQLVLSDPGNLLLLRAAA